MVKLSGFDIMAIDVYLLGNSMNFPQKSIEYVSILRCFIFSAEIVKIHHEISPYAM